MKFKRVIAVLLCAAMLIGTGVCSFADGTTNMTGIGDVITDKIQITSNGGERIKSGYTLSVSYKDNSGICAEESTVDFYSSDDSGANWTEIENTGDTYTITNAMANKQICAVVTSANENKYVSNTVTVGANLEQRLGFDQKAPNIVEKAPDNNKFVLTDGTNKSKELTLLGIQGNKAFVIAPSSGPSAFYDDSTAQFQIIDINNPKSLFYKINQAEYIAQNVLPASMQEYLLTTGWETEAGCQTLDSSHSNMKNDTVIFSKIAIPSQNEFYDNADKIGYKDATGLMLRSPYIKDNDGRMQAVNPRGGGIAVVNSHSNNYYSVRPCFYVNTDIFKNVKAESAGSEVVKVILATKNENKIYSDDEWNEFDFGGITGAEDVKLNITSNGGERIKSGYTLTAAKNEGETFDAQTIVYFVSDSENGPWEMAGTADKDGKFTLLNAHANKYIVAAAKVKNSDETYTKYISNKLKVGENSAASPGVWGKVPEITENGVTYKMKAFADKTDRLYLDADGYRGIGYTLLDSDDNNVLLLSDALDNTPTYKDKNNETKKYQIYDSTDPNSIAYHINTDKFITNNIVPSGCESYINTTIWETEAGNADKMKSDTVDISRVALPSMTELYKYIKKVGYCDGGSGTKTRTPQTTGIDFKNILPWGDMQYLESTSNFYQCRVEVSIKKDLYKEVKLDAVNSGIDALAAVGLPNRLTIDEAKKKGYSNEELIKLGYFETQICSALTNISVSGNSVTADIATSNPKTALDAKIICAVHDSNGGLKFIKSDDVTVAHGEGKIQKTIELSNNIASTDKLSFYLWKDETDISPISAKLFGAERNTVRIASVVGTTEIPYNSDIFEYNGRWQADAANGCMTGNWAYPYIDFSVKATSLALNFVGADKADTRELRVFVNDKEVLKCQNNKTQIDISQYLSDGVSNVRVMCNTETSQTMFGGITVNEGAEVLPPKQSRGNMLLIGDSISSASYSYTYTLPLALGMDNTRISRSGIAFLDGYRAGNAKEGAVGMQTKFKHMQTVDVGTDEYDFKDDDKYDIVIVNIGTNDVYKSQDGTIDNIEKIKTDYKAFIDFLSVTYTNAKIIVIKPVRKSAYWKGDTATQNNAYWRSMTFNEIGTAITKGEYGQNVYYVDTTDWDIDINDIDNIHPTVAGHEQIKSRLIKFLVDNRLIG